VAAVPGFAGSGERGDCAGSRTLCDLYDLHSVRDNIENRVYEMYPLMLDVVFFSSAPFIPRAKGFG